MRNDKIEFKEWLEEKGYAKSTIKYCLQVLNDTPEMGNYEELLKHLESLRRRLKLSTINQRLVVLGHYGNYLKDQGILGHNFYKKVSMKPGQRELFNALDMKELEELHVNYPSITSHELRDKILLGLLIYQSVDVGTLKYLQKGDINLEKGEIYLRGGTRMNSRTLSLHGSQVLPLHRQIEIEEGEYLMKGSLHSYYSLMLRGIKRRDNKIVSVRQIRRSVIVSWLKKYNLREVQYYCGHKHISSTENYKEVDIDSLKDELRKYHLVHCDR